MTNIDKNENNVKIKIKKMISFFRPILSERGPKIIGDNPRPSKYTDKDICTRL